MIRQRNLVTCIILTFVTCGIYSIYWMICMTDETNAVHGEPGTTGVTAFLLTLVTCGIYHFIWLFKQGEKLDEAKNRRGIVSSNSNILYLLLSFFGLSIVSYALMQDSLNKLAE